MNESTNCVWVSYHNLFNSDYRIFLSSSDNYDASPPPPYTQMKYSFIASLDLDSQTIVTSRCKSKHDLTIFVPDGNLDCKNKNVTHSLELLGLCSGIGHEHPDVLMCEVFYWAHKDAEGQPLSAAHVLVIFAFQFLIFLASNKACSATIVVIVRPANYLTVSSVVGTCSPTDEIHSILRKAINKK